MNDAEPPEDAAFRTRLASRLTELRLAIDLGEITTPAAFQRALERGDEFTLSDPRVRSACVAAGLAAWIG